MTTIRQQGIDASLAGVYSHHNPYRDDPQAAHEWTDGWLHGEAVKFLRNQEKARVELIAQTARCEAEGKAAYHAGKSRDDNPYMSNPHDFARLDATAWRYGWERAAGIPVLLIPPPLAT